MATILVYECRDAPPDERFLARLKDPMAGPGLQALGDTASSAMFNAERQLDAIKTAMEAAGKHQGRIQKALTKPAPSKPPAPLLEPIFDDGEAI